MLNFPQNGFFVEFGATDGFSINNTYLLEGIGWDGISIEPNPDYFKKLKANRKTLVSNKCIWDKDGQTISFRNVIDNPELSRVDEIKPTDDHEKEGLRSKYKIEKVETIRLETLLDQIEGPKLIDYISIDVEGGEESIVYDFPFDKYSVKLFSIEHNFTSSREKIHHYLREKGYRRVLPEFSRFDDWYVSQSLGNNKPDNNLENSLFASLPKDLPQPVRDSTAIITRTVRQLVGLGQIHPARKILLTCLRKQPDDIQTKKDLAQFEFLNGDQIKAQKYLKDCIKVNGGDEDVYEWLGRMYFEQEKNNLALRTIEEGIVKFPDADNLRVLKVYFLLSMNKIFSRDGILDVIDEQKKSSD